MKHLLNNLTKEEKNRIREQYDGKIYIDTSKFRRLMESKLGDVKPLLTEQGDLATNTKNCGWGTDSESYKQSGWMCPKAVPSSWANFPCVPSHPSATWSKNENGTFSITLNGVVYYDNGRKTQSGKQLEYTCKDPEFANIKILGGGAKVVKPADAPQDIKAFQNWVINTKKDTRILGTYGADGKWGPRTQSAWTLYKTEFNPSLAPTTTTTTTISPVKAVADNTSVSLPNVQSLIQRQNAALNL